CARRVRFEFDYW
nr:immunoglobulin heavy chain junction region [Macaca mulatta]